MDRLTSDYVPPGRIELARQADFALGRLIIRPSQRTVEDANSRFLLQRRVMQVLVALADSRGEVVSQRELIQRCWDGLIVSDDAIGRCVAQLRRFAGRWEEPPFTIETIAGVGYRLKAAHSPYSAADASPSGGARRPPIALLGCAGAAAIIFAAAAGVSGFWLGHTERPTVEVEPIQVLDGVPEVKALAARIEDAAGGALTEAGVKTTPPRLAFPFQKTGGQGLMLGGTVREDAGVAHVRLYLEERRSGAMLWSAEIAGRADGLADQAAALATDTVFNVLEQAQQPGLRLSPHTIGLYARAVQFTERPELLHADEARHDLEQVLAEAPQSAPARATYALALATWGSRLSLPDRQRMTDQAAAEAEKAIKQSPSNAGAAYDALYFVQRIRRPGDFAVAEGQILAGLRAAPSFPFLPMRECQLLDELGRAQAALPYCQRAAALRPVAPSIGWKYAMALDAAGQTEWAQRQMEWSQRLNPAQEAMRLGRFKLAAFGPSPEAALELMRDEATAPHNISPNGAAALKAFLIARMASASPGSSRLEAISALTRAAKSGDLELGLAVSALAQLEAKDEVFSLLANAGSRRFIWGGGVGFLTDRAAASLRSDPRYWTVVSRLGLVDYWRRKGWPDFCDEPTSHLNCPYMAASAIRGSATG